MRGNILCRRTKQVSVIRSRGGWIIPIKIRESEKSNRWNGKRGEEGGLEGVKITRCAGNGRKYKPGEISQAGNIPIRRRSTNTRDCSIPSISLPPLSSGSLSSCQSHRRWRRFYCGLSAAALNVPCRRIFASHASLGYPFILSE